MALYLQYHDPWHLQQAAMLRNYLRELKAYIHKKEGK